jgi:opacity protein-like surface antigen
VRAIGRIATVALLANNAAQAADAPMPMKAPPPVATHNWAGLYVGGHVGAGFSYRNWTLGDGAISCTHKIDRRGAT